MHLHVYIHVIVHCLQKGIKMFKTSCSFGLLRSYTGNTRRYFMGDSLVIEAFILDITC